MGKHQHGRKPQKGWHRKGAFKRMRKALRHWPDEVPADVVYDGAPTPLRQGHAKRRRMDSL